MGAIASLINTQLSVAPGDSVTTELRIANNGDVVDEFTIEPLGDAADWIEPIPRTVSLFPGADQIVTVIFAPPRAPTVRPGPTPFALKVVSREDATGSIVEEGAIDVGSFDDRSIELHPTTVTGRLGARYELAIDNRGNEPIDVALAGSDPQAACDYRFSKDVVTVEPGTAVFTKLRVKPRVKVWKGAPVPHQFQVLASNAIDASKIDGLAAEFDALVPGADLAPPTAPTVVPADVHAPVMAPGTYVQQAVLPPWIVKAVLLTIAAIVVLWILWKTLLQPTVESTARDAVADPIQALEERVEAVETTVPALADVPAGEDGAGEEDGGGAQDGAGEDGAGADDAGVEDGGVGAEEPATPADAVFSTPFGNPVDFQLGDRVAAGNSAPFTGSVPGDFSLTDMIIQNPRGDTGFVTISRGADDIFVSALENFRDLDRHFVAPYLFPEGQSLTMTITCTTAVDPAGCDISASFAGFAK